MEGSDWLKSKGESCACLHGLTFLQSLDLLLCEAGPVPLQLPLELQPQLRQRTGRERTTEVQRRLFNSFKGETVCRWRQNAAALALNQALFPFE